MEPAFVCEFVPTVKMITNRIRHYNLVRWIILIVIGLYGVKSILLPAIFYLSYGFDPQWTFFALVGILLPIYSLFYCQIAAYFSVRQYKKAYGADGRSSYRFGETIEIQEGKVRMILDYGEITAVKRLKYTYELKLDKRRAVYVVPECFTKGTFEEFKQFLHTKCPNLTIPE